MGKKQRNNDISLSTFDDINAEDYDASYEHATKKQGRKELNRTVTTKILENVFGISVGNKSQKKTVPDGFILKYTKTGRPYLERGDIGAEDDIGKKAASEHERPDLSIWCSRRTLRENYGTGVYLYFDFLRFVTWCNLALLILCLINTIAHFYYDGLHNPSRKVTSLYRNLYISTYYERSYNIWAITSILSVLLWYLFGPIYAIKVGRYFARRNQFDFEDEYEEDDIIIENKHYRHGQRAVRLIISYSITILLLVISGGASFGVVLLNYNVGQVIASIAIACIIRVVNFIWLKICTALTTFEKHRTWNAFRKNNTIKFYLFKMINVLIMYGMRKVVLYYDIRFKIPFEESTASIFDSDQVENECELIQVGDQVLYIILLDLILANLWEIFWPKFLYLIRKKAGERNNSSNDSVRPEFDLAEEYMEVFYRQFVLYLGLSVFPLITFLGLISSMVEPLIDKYRLIRICREPARMDGSMKKFIVFFLFTTAVFASFSYPYGAFWVIFGEVTDSCTGTKTEPWIFDDPPIHL